MTLAEFIDRFNAAIGRICAWLTLAMVIITCAIVVMRYAFDTGWIWLQESVNWMHAAVFMLAAAYTLAKDEHVRVDIFYKDFGRRGQAFVDAAGTLLFLIPLSVFLIWVSWDYVAIAWKIREASVEAGGLPYPWVPLLKSFIPAMSVLLLLQGISLLIRSVTTLRSNG
jgi:TRAP-type mannitol/chloroaromatic compound transport system permease small subunit